MNNRERQTEGPTSTARMAQQLDRPSHAGAIALSPVMWQSSRVRVPPVLGSPAGVLRIQQLKGNRALGQMLAVQQSAEAEGLHEPSDETIRSAAAEGVRTPVVTLPFLDRIQASFGRHPLGHVKAHIGPEAAKASRAMNALAFATGDHVVFGGTPDLRTAAHEAAHIVQQGAGLRLAGGVGREGDAYERHADAVAAAVVAGRSAEGLLEPFAASATVGKPGAFVSTQGQQLPGQELTQVVQQHSGRVRNPLGSRIAIGQYQARECEADCMGMPTATYRAPVQAKLERSEKRSGSSAAIQMIGNRSEYYYARYHGNLSNINALNAVNLAALWGAHATLRFTDYTPFPFIIIHDPMRHGAAAVRGWLNGALGGADNYDLRRGAAPF